MMNKSPRPPQPLLNFFRWFCNDSMQSFIEGDLLEVYQRRFRTKGKRHADVMFVLDVILLFRPGIIGFSTLLRLHGNPTMIHSYFRTGWRNMLRSRLYALINVVGLAFGMVCFILIGLYVVDELTFDREHTYGDRIYRLIEHRTVDSETSTIAAGGYKLAEEAPRVIPEIEATTRFSRSGRANLIDPDHPVNVQENVTVADEHFLQIFDFVLLHGDRRTALKAPNSIVVTEQLANRIFRTSDVIGRSLKFGHLNAPLTITGVLKNYASNSSFAFSSILSESTFYADDDFHGTMDSDWASQNFTIYALLRPGAQVDSVSHRLTALVHQNLSQR